MKLIFNKFFSQLNMLFDFFYLKKIINRHFFLFIGFFLRILYFLIKLFHR